MIEARALWTDKERFLGEASSGHALIVGGNVTHKAMEDAVRLSKEKYCSVSAMLEKAAMIEFAIEYA